MNSTGASRVHVFDHKVRRGPTNWHSIKENNRLQKGPLRRAHIDQSYDGAYMVLKKHLPEEADSLMKKRFQIINVSTACSIYSRESSKYCRRFGGQSRPSTKTLLL